MSEKRTYKLVSDQVRAHCIDEIARAPLGKVVIVQDPTRTLEQNALMWAMLADISKQVDWYGQRLTSEEWKDVFSASLKRQKVVPGLDNNFVVCGQRTSRMTKKEMSDLCELMMAFGVEHEVKFSDRRDLEANPFA